MRAVREGGGVMFIPIAKPFTIRRADSGWAIVGPDGNDVAHAPDLQMARVLAASPAAIDAAFADDPSHACRDPRCPKCAVVRCLTGFEVVR